MAQPESWTLPDAPSAYQGVTAVLLGDVAPQDLSLSQQRALRIWVERGGRLILVPTRTKSWRGTFLEDLTGLDGLIFTGKGDVGRLALRYQTPFPEASRSTLAVLRGIEGDVLVDGPDGPLVLLKTVGSGHVIFLAFDPWTAPLAGWEGGRRLLRDIWDRTVRLNWERPAAIGSDWLASRVREREAPGGGFASTILLACLFAILVGPGSYVVLKRRKRPGLIWVAVPLVSILAAISSAALTAVYGRVSSTCLSATILQLHPESPRGIVDRHILYQSRGRERHELTLGGKGISGNTGRLHHGGLDFLSLSREGRDRWNLDPLMVPRWGAALVQAHAEYELDGPVVTRLAAGKDTLTLSVENRSSLRLFDAFVTGLPYPVRAGGYLVAFGTISPGETAERVLARREGEDWVRDEKGSATAGISRSTLKFLFDTSSRSTPQPTCLLARIGNPEADRMIDARYDSLTEPAGTYAFLGVPVETVPDEEGSFRLGLASLFSLEFNDPSGKKESHVIWEYILPSMPGTIRLDSIELSFRQEHLPDLEGIEIYDWQDEVWIPLKSVVEIPEVPPPQGPPQPRPSSYRPITPVILRSDWERHILRPEGVAAIRKVYPPGTFPPNYPMPPVIWFALEGTVEPDDSQ